MDYQIREIEEKEYYLLEDFLYEAIFIPKGMTAPPKSIIRQPELQVYIAGLERKKMILVLLQRCTGKLQEPSGFVL